MPKSSKTKPMPPPPAKGKLVMDKSKSAKGGRPRKFGEPSQPVTFTLPQSTLQVLAEVDPDRATAVVRLASEIRSTSQTTARLARTVDIGKGRAVIMVASSRCLKKIPFLHLIETSPGEFLLALQPGHDFKNLELAIRDELEDLPADEERERKLLSALLDCFTQTRRQNLGIRAEILLVTKPRKRAAES